MREASRIGVSALTLAPVAERAGWSKSGLLRHFPTKEALQVAVVQRTSELFRERVLLPSLSTPPGAPRLRAIFQRWLGWIHDSGLDGGCPLNGARLEFDDQPGEVRDALVAGWNEWMAYLERHATKAIELKQISTPLAPRQVVMVMCGLASAADSGSRLLGKRETLRDAERAFDQLFPLKTH
jgi:AcrR family transcriptional regulator